MIDQAANEADDTGYVSMPSLAMTLVNLDRTTTTGENNYALAA